MQYALVKSIKSEPYRGLRGTCPGCGMEMIAKCGDIKLHHWAHKAGAQCDSWWEPETTWHREWKNLFPDSSREITFYDDSLGEHHRADVHTEAGLTLEFQNSPLSINEMRSREGFYRKMIWVINGLNFKGFELGVALPDPNLPILKEYELIGRSHVILKNLGNDGKKNSKGISLKHFQLDHPKVSPLRTPGSYYSFSWKRPHRTWYSAARPVFIDFGGHFLYWLKCRKQASGDFLYLQLVSKQKFLKKYR